MINLTKSFPVFMTDSNGYILLSFTPVCVLEANLTTVSKSMNTPSVEGQDGVPYYVAHFKSVFISIAMQPQPQI